VVILVPTDAKGIPATTPILADRADLVIRAA
jgi:hypothetical protein